MHEPISAYLRQKRIARLQARAAWLAKRIEEQPNRNLSYDEAELTATQWAIEELIALYPDSAPPPKKR
jgi:hypothetical protein